jgi:hypothetical protein
MPVDYNAGKSVSTWDMDLSPLRAKVIEAKRLYAQLAAASQQAAQSRGTQTVVPAGMAPGAINVGSGPGIDRAAVAAAKLAAEQNKAALAGQRLATEQQRTAVAAANVGRAETQAAAAALRYSQQQQKANDAAGKGTSSFGQLAQGLQGVQGLLGAAGISLGASALIQGGVAAGQYSVAVRQTEGVLRQLAGSQARYNELTGIAAQNQRLFGGSLADNYAPLTGVLALSNQTGASLSQLNGVTQLLLAKAPGKSAGDAFFGLGEFLSGKGAEAALSISDQFNLNKQAVAALAAEGVSAEQRLAGLTQMLAAQGVSSETLTARLTEQAVAYNELGAAVDQARLHVGDFLADAGVPAARGATRLLRGDWEAMSLSIQESNRQIVQSIIDLRAAQTGVAAGGGGGGGGDWSTRATEEQTAANQASAQAAFGVVNASNAQTLAIQGAAAASTTDAVAKVRQAVEADIAKAKTADLSAALNAAAAGSDVASVAALKLAAVYGKEQYPELLKIISALREKTALEGGTAKGYGGSAPADAARSLAVSAASQSRLKTEQAITEATGSTAEKLALNARLLRTVAAGSEDERRLLVERAVLTKQLASERTKAGTSADKLATKEASAANAEAVARRDALRRIEDLYQDHYDRMRRLQEDYTLSQSRKQEDYELERQRLLANGQIKEAQLLEEKFNLQKKRDEEDAARQRQREQEQAAQQIADAQEQAGLKAGDRERKRLLSGVALGDVGAVDAAGARQAQAEASLAATAGQRPSGGLLRLEFAPINLLLDGQTVATAIYPAIEAQLDADWSEKIATILITAPPGGGQGGGVGGPRP